MEPKNGSSEIAFGRLPVLEGRSPPFLSIKPFRIIRNQIRTKSGAFERDSMQSSEASPDADSCGPTESIPAVRIWGPVPKEQAVAVGALAAVSSMVLAPQQAPAWLFNSLAALVPDEVLPRASDTAQTLRMRLQRSTFLHPIQTMAKGHGRGGRYVELNATTYPQPRRVQWGSQTRRCPSTLTQTATVWCSVFATLTTTQSRRCCAWSR